MTESSPDSAAINANQVEDALPVIEALEQLLGRIAFLGEERAIQLQRGRDPWERAAPVISRQGITASVAGSLTGNGLSAGQHQ